MVKFATYMRDHDWLATVVAPQPCENMWKDPSQMELIGAKNVIRVGKAGQNSNFLNRVARRLSPLDAFYGWADSVSQTLNKNLLENTKVIFTSGPPHSTHLVGYRLKKKCGIPWVADFRDHFTLGPEYRPITPFHKIYDNRFEKKVLQYADRVICNTRINRRDIIARFGVRFANKLIVIYNGYDPNDLVPTGDLITWPTQRRNYLYLGGLRGGAIDDTFFGLLDRLVRQFPERAEQIALRVVGDASRRSRLVGDLIDAGILTIHEPVPANALGRVLEAADGCVAWQRNESRYRGTIGGKIFDYLSSSTPIFSLGQPNGEIDRLLRRLKRGISCCPEPVDQALACFLRFDDAVKNKCFNSDMRAEAVERFSRQYQASQLATVFDSIVR